MRALTPIAEGSPDSHKLLASAVAGRSIEVIPGRPGEPTWTDGRTVVVDPTLPRELAVRSVVVQAALVGAGSLESDVMRRLARSRRTRERYLNIEARRALASLSSVLPAGYDLDPLTSAPTESYALARNSSRLPEALPSFGGLKPRAVLAVQKEEARETVPELDALEELLEQTGAGGLDSLSAADGNLLGRLLRRLLRLRGSGSTGEGAPGGEGVRFKARATRQPTGVTTNEAGQAPETRRSDDRQARYPEWDVRLARYRPDWCAVTVLDPVEAPIAPPVNDLGLRRPLSRIGAGLRPVRRQRYGDDLDLDAVVESQVDLRVGLEPADALYVATLRGQRDLAVLVLLDISGSVEEPGVGQAPVHQHQRAVAAALTHTLHQLGDRVALYAYQSQGRSDVRMTAVKRFDEAHDTALLPRLHGLKPGAYSRLGAAVRHGGHVLNHDGGTVRRLLVVISDGLAFDHGYNRDHGAADVRRAIAEVRRDGAGCLCLTVGTLGAAEDLRQVFGTAAHAVVPRPDQLADAIGPLFTSALRTASTRERSHR